MGNEWAHVKTFSHVVKVKKGEVIYHIGERISTFYFIEKGMIKLAEDSFEGRSVTIALNHSSEFIGYIDYLKGNKEHTQYATALTDSVLYSIPIDIFNTSSTVKELVYESMVHALTEAQQLIYVLSTMTVPERLKWLLLKLAIKKEGFLVIEIPLTHEEMSNILGCSRQKITTFLNKWKKEGHLISERGIIKIIHEEKIR